MKVSSILSLLATSAFSLALATAPSFANEATKDVKKIAKSTVNVADKTVKKTEDVAKSAIHKTHKKIKKLSTPRKHVAKKSSGCAQYTLDEGDSYALSNASSPDFLINNKDKIIEYNEHYNAMHKAASKANCPVRTITGGIAHHVAL